MDGPSLFPSLPKLTILIVIFVQIVNSSLQNNKYTVKISTFCRNFIGWLHTEDCRLAQCNVRYQIPTLPSVSVSVHQGSSILTLTHQIINHREDNLFKYLFKQSSYKRFKQGDTVCLDLSINVNIEEPCSAFIPSGTIFHSDVQILAGSHGLQHI